MTPRIIDALKEDHREIEDYYNKILSATTEKEKTQWQNQFTWELARHSLGEELVVYPVFEKALPDGRAMADNDRKQHNSVSSHLPSEALVVSLTELGQRTTQEISKHESLRP
jgi:hemerythrin superfamily protein